MSGEVQRCSGTHALLLTAAVVDLPPSSPLLGCWLTLHCSKGRYSGDVVASASEPMPFTDEAFQLVLIQHVFEVSSTPAALLHEAVRVLAPGGVLVITGLHPLSAWSPWFWWRGRGAVQRLHFPLGLKAMLIGAGVDVERISRVGRSWPARSSSSARPENFFGGGYVLVAKKRSHAMTRLHLGRITAPLPSHGRLAAETRRSAAQ